MKKIILLCTCCLCILVHANAQTGKTDSIPPPPPTSEYPNERENVIFERVEVEASFPGGDKKWREYLQNNLNANVPIDNNAPDGVYMVIVQFIVDRNGKISDVRALTAHGYGMEQEVVRVIKKGPEWKPAVQSGRVVRAYRKQPVTFEVVTKKRKRKNKD